MNEPVIDYIKIVESYEFKVIPRKDAPESVQQKPYPGTWCIYDPLDSDDGFCLIGDNPAALAKDCAEHFEMT